MRFANNPDDEEHAIFWLIVADELAKRAIACAAFAKKP